MRHGIGLKGDFGGGSVLAFHFLGPSVRPGASRVACLNGRLSPDPTGSEDDGHWV